MATQPVGVAERAAEWLERLTPRAERSEQALIGALLLWPDAYDKVVDVVRDSDFFTERHRLTFRAIANMIEAGRPVDPVLVIEDLGRRGELDRAGGRAYLGSLAVEALSPATARGHAETVRNKARLRQALAAAHSIQEMVAAGKEPEEVLEAAEQALYELREGERRDEMQDMASILTGAIEHIDRMYAMEGEKLAGVPSGLIDLDHMIGGFEGGDLIVVGARPSMGKTALALGFGEHVARRQKGAVAVFSLEMSGLQLGLRHISANANIGMHELRTGSIQEDDWRGIVSAAERLRDLPVYIDDRSGVSVGYIRSRCRRLHRRAGGLSLVIVDYLTLMDGPGDSRDERVGAIAKGLKQIAKELRVPVIALAQLNRSCEQRTDKRPVMADLRESGEIEQAADVVMFVYREEVYDKETRVYKGVAELIVGKQRNGPTGIVYTTFLGKTMRFVNIAPDWTPPALEPKQSRSRAADFSDYKTRAAGDGPH